MKVIGVYRAKRFSPGKSESDKAILDSVIERLKRKGWNTDTVTEEGLKDSRYLSVTCPLSARYLPDTCYYLSMARSETALTMLEDEKCINSVDGIRACSERRYLADTADDTFPCWIKRADGCAEEKADVSFCESQDELERVIESFKKRGIERWVVQPHYDGDLVKFYGVEGTSFLHTSYPTETGQTKFGLETHNDVCQHYNFNQQELKTMADETAKKLKVLVYGGDAVIDADGGIHIIDFNDWPSFSPCREKAAEAITELFINSLIR